MAKSLRAKVKMSARRKKRETGFYAATEAARLERLSAKLLGKGKGKETEYKLQSGTLAEGDVEDANEGGVAEDGEGDATMAEVTEQPKKISTSAPRDTRREQWRVAKGMAARPKGKGTNRQGLATGRSKAGRPKRRR